MVAVDPLHCIVVDQTREDDNEVNDNEKKIADDDDDMVAVHPPQCIETDPMELARDKRYRPLDSSLRSYDRYLTKFDKNIMFVDLTRKDDNETIDDEKKIAATNDNVASDNDDIHDADKVSPTRPQQFIDSSDDDSEPLPDLYEYEEEPGRRDSDGEIERLFRDSSDTDSGYEDDEHDDLSSTMDDDIEYQRLELSCEELVPLIIAMDRWDRFISDNDDEDEDTDNVVESEDNEDNEDNEDCLADRDHRDIVFKRGRLDSNSDDDDKEGNEERSDMDNDKEGNEDCLADRDHRRCGIGIKRRSMTTTTRTIFPTPHRL